MEGDLHSISQKAGADELGADVKGIRLSAASCRSPLPCRSVLPQKPLPLGSPLTQPPPYFLLPLFPGRIPKGHPNRVCSNSPQASSSNPKPRLSPEIEDEVPQILKESISFLHVGRGGLTQLAGPCYLDRKRSTREAQKLTRRHRTQQQKH